MIGGISRYDRLTRYSGLGAEGLARIADTSLAIVGCGGLGGAIVAILARYPFKRIKLIDRDVVETSNLAHQLLFTPAHAERGIAKVKAAREYIASVNPGLAVEPHFDDLRSANIERLLAGSDVVLDGLDNFRTRFLVNDWCVKNRIPYVYSGIVENSCSVKAVIPGVTSCLRCLMPEPPEPGTIRTCDVYGVHLPVLTLAASIAADLALRVAARADAVAAGAIGAPMEFALDSGAIVQSVVRSAAIPNLACRTCRGHYDFLDGAGADSIEEVCGQDAIAMQVSGGFALDEVAARLTGDFEVWANEFFVRAEPPQSGTRFSVFSHGRVLLEGSRDAATLRTFVSRYIGN